jgi:hypothetical protein
VQPHTATGPAAGRVHASLALLSPLAREAVNETVFLRNTTSKPTGIAELASRMRSPRCDA